MKKNLSNYSKDIVITWKYVEFGFGRAFRASSQACTSKSLINFITTCFWPKTVLYNLFTFIIHHIGSEWLSTTSKIHSSFKDKDILRMYFSV